MSVQRNICCCCSIMQYFAKQHSIWLYILLEKMEQSFEVMLSYTITALEMDCLFIAASYLRNFWDNLIISKQIILLKSIEKFLRLALNYWISLMELNTDILVVVKWLTGKLEPENWHSTYNWLSILKKHYAIYTVITILSKSSLSLF